MPRQQVDEAALSEDREGGLGSEGPRPLAGEPAGSGLMERGVSCVHQPIELASPPAGSDLDSDVERRTDSSQPIECHGSQVTSLDARDRRGRHSGDPGGVRLALPASDADRAERCPEALIGHATILPGSAYQPVICSSGGSRCGSRRSPLTDFPGPRCRFGPCLSTSPDRTATSRRTVASFGDEAALEWV